MDQPENRTITKKELVNRISEETSQTKVVVKEILQRFLDEIILELSHGLGCGLCRHGVGHVTEPRGDQLCARAEGNKNSVQQKN